MKYGTDKTRQSQNKLFKWVEKKKHKNVGIAEVQKKAGLEYECASKLLIAVTNFIGPNDDSSSWDNVLPADFGNFISHH